MTQAMNRGRQALALPRDTLAFFIKCALRNEQGQRVLPTVSSSQFTFVNQQAVLNETLFIPYAAAADFARSSTWSSRIWTVIIALCRVDVHDRATNEWAKGFFQVRHVDRWIVDMHRIFPTTNDEPQQTLELGYCVISMKAV